MKEIRDLYKFLFLDTKMVSIHIHLTIKDGKREQCISLLEEILVFIKFSETECLFFNITKFGSNKFYLREAYKDASFSSSQGYEIYDSQAF